MRKSLVAALALGIASIAAPVLAQDSTPPAATENADQQAKARTLALTMNPLEAFQSTAAEGFASEFEKGVATNPFFAEMEAATPGFTAFISARMLESLSEQMAAAHPVLVADLSRIFADTMTVSQLDAAIGFYQSPTGQKVIALQYSNTAVDQDFLSCIESGKTDCVTAEMIEAQAAAQGMATTASLSSTELVDAAAFYDSDAGRAINGLAPKLNEAAANWTNALMANVESTSIGAVQIAIADWMDMQEEKKKP